MNVVFKALTQCWAKAGFTLRLTDLLFSLSACRSEPAGGVREQQGEDRAAGGAGAVHEAADGAELGGGTATRRAGAVAARVAPAHPPGGATAGGVRAG